MERSKPVYIRNGFHGEFKYCGMSAGPNSILKVLLNYTTELEIRRGIEDNS